MGFFNDPAMTKALEKKIKKPKQPGRIVYPKGTEENYRKFLNRILRFARQRVIQELYPVIPELVNEANQFRPDADGEVKNDAYISKLLGTIRKIRLQVETVFPESEINAEVEETANKVSEQNRKQVTQSIKKAVGIDVLLSEPYLEDRLTDFAASNVDLITSMSEEYLTRVQRAVSTAVEGGMRAEEVLRQIPDAAGVSRRKAKMIARDQVAKLTGQLNMMRQQELGLGKYIWRTQRDERVRSSHAQHEGEVYSWDNPPADTGHPGQDYQCRCWAEPVIELPE